MSGETLPVFPWTTAQVEEVADALEAAGDGADSMELSRCALRAAARVMRMESKPDPMDYPSGYGYWSVRGVTQWATVKPDGSWELQS